MAPTGAYHDQYLINVSSHRWAFRPDIGGSLPIGNWFVEGSAGLWVFTPNTDFYGGHLRGQEAIGTLQAHVGYNFGPNFWVALDANQYMGGRTSQDGVNANNDQSVFRYGATLSVPLGNGFSAKASWGSWLTAHNGGAFTKSALPSSIAGLIADEPYERFGRRNYPAGACCLARNAGNCQNHSSGPLHIQLNVIPMSPGIPSG